MRIFGKRFVWLFGWYLLGGIVFGSAWLMAQPADTEAPADENLMALSGSSWGLVFRPHNEIVAIGRRGLVVPPGERTRNVVVVAGSVQIDGEVDGDVVVVGGTVIVNGRVRGSVIVGGGAAEFWPGAEVGREVLLIGGPFTISPDALLPRNQTEVQIPWLLPTFTALQTFLANTVFLARPFAPNLGWTWWVAGGLFLFNLFILMLLPGVNQQSVRVLVSRPVTTFLVGTCLVVLFGPLVVLLIASGFGILLLPFLFCISLAAFLVGKVAVYTSVGRQILRPVLGERALPVITFTVGSILLMIAYMIPLIGFMALGLVMPLAVGAVSLAAWNAFVGESHLGGSGGDRGKPLNAMSKAAPVEQPDPKVGLGPENLGSAGTRIDPESEPLSLRAGFWPRLGATLIDFALVAILFSLLISDGGPGMFRFFLVFWLGYHVLLWKLQGSTVGGYVLGLRCVTLDGGASRSRLAPSGYRYSLEQGPPPPDNARRRRLDRERFCSRPGI
jgi:hypothetical protein